MKRESWTMSLYLRKSSAYHKSGKEEEQPGSDPQQNQSSTEPAFYFIYLRIASLVCLMTSNTGSLYLVGNKTYWGYSSHRQTNAASRKRRLYFSDYRRQALVEDHTHHLWRTFQNVNENPIWHCLLWKARQWLRIRLNYPPPVYILV